MVGFHVASANRELRLAVDTNQMIELQNTHENIVKTKPSQKYKAGADAVEQELLQKATVQSRLPVGPA